MKREIKPNREEPEETQDLWHKVLGGMCYKGHNTDLRPVVEELGTEGFEGLARKEMMKSFLINYREISRLSGILTSRTYIGRENYILYRDEKCASWILSKPVDNGYYRNMLWFFKEGGESKPIYETDRRLSLVGMSPTKICVSVPITGADWVLRDINVLQEAARG